MALSSCVDLKRDRRLIGFIDHSTDSKIYSLDKQYERDSLAYFSKKYNFSKIKNELLWRSQEKSLNSIFKVHFDGEIFN